MSLNKKFRNVELNNKSKENDIYYYSIIKGIENFINKVLDNEKDNKYILKEIIRKVLELK